MYSFVMLLIDKRHYDKTITITNDQKRIVYFQSQNEISTDSVIITEIMFKTSFIPIC